jgi:hypothetical protein
MATMQYNFKKITHVRRTRGAGLGVGARAAQSGCIMHFEKITRCRGSIARVTFAERRLHRASHTPSRGEGPTQRLYTAF